MTDEGRGHATAWPLPCFMPNTHALSSAVLWGICKKTRYRLAAAEAAMTTHATASQHEHQGASQGQGSPYSDPPDRKAHNQDQSSRWSATAARTARNRPSAIAPPVTLSATDFRA
jgi:hypothetical protein